MVALVRTSPFGEIVRIEANGGVQLHIQVGSEAALHKPDAHENAGRGLPFSELLLRKISPFNQVVQIILDLNYGK